jgi:hypothetical protein
MTVEPNQASITIGDQFADHNKLVFTITLTGDGKVPLSLFVPVGENGLIAAAEDEVVVRTEGTTPSPSAQPYDRVKRRKEWKLGSRSGIDVAGRKQVAVSIDKVLCRASEGDAALTVCSTAKGQESLTKSIQIDKKRPTIGTPGKPTDPPAVLSNNAILYFTANPSFLSRSGIVKLSWDLAKSDYKVYLQIPRKSEEILNPQPNPYPSEVLSEKADFTLLLRDANKNEIARRPLSIDVLAKGWHEIYPLGKDAFPSVIFDSNANERYPFYAICVRASAPVLCKSDNGLADWEVIGPKVPEEGASSPGILWQDRLWLIGGSTADPSQKSNSIYYLDPKNPGDGWTQLVGAVDRNDKSNSICYVEKALLKHGEKWVASAAFEERMGHACVIVSDTEFWVLGGIGKFGIALNDVWIFQFDKTTSRLTAKKAVCTSQFTARCMFTALRFKGAVWVFGGVDRPANGQPLSDIWKKKDSWTGWHPRPLKKDKKDKEDKEEKYITDHAIGTGGTVMQPQVVGKVPPKMYVVVTSSKGTEQIRIPSEMDWLDESYDPKEESDAATSGKDLWNPDPLKPPRPDWATHPHSVSLVTFQGRIYVRYLNRNLLQPSSDLVKPALYVYNP